MFFFLSKTLGYLIRPMFIITIGFLLSWVLKNARWKKRIFIFSLSLLLFMSNDFIANEVMRAWELPATPFRDINKKYEYGIVLSGVAKSEVGPPDRVFLGSGADRVNHTLQLYRLGVIKKILISGGSGMLLDNGVREADQLSSLFQLMNVPKADILVETESRNTHESAEAVKKILQGSATPDQCLLITSANHMRRSLACFAKAGWKTDTFSVDFQSHMRRFTFDVLFIPKLDALGNWNVLSKEWAGYITYWVAGYL